MDSKQSSAHPDMSCLLQEIVDFLDQTGMGVSYFGKKAVGNSELVSRLRSGCEIKRRTEAGVRKFIEAETKRRADAVVSEVAK